MEEKAREEDAPGRFSLLGTASVMGMHMVSGPVVGAGLGWLADSWLDSWPVGAGIGLLLGVIAGFRNVWKDARYLQRADAAIDRKEAEDAARGKKPAAQAEKKDASRGSPGVSDAPSLQASGDEDSVYSASIIAGTAEAGDFEQQDDPEELLRAALREGMEENGREPAQESSHVHY